MCVLNLCLDPVTSLFHQKFILGKHLQRGNSGLMLMSIVLQWISMNNCDVDEHCATMDWHEQL